MSITAEQRKRLQALLARRGASRKVDPADVARRYLEGQKVCDIAAELGVTVQTVYMNLKKATEDK